MRLGLLPFHLRACAPRCAVPALPAGLRYSAVAAGGVHTVLLREDGVALAVGCSPQPQPATEEALKSAVGGGRENVQTS